SELCQCVAGTSRAAFLAGSFFLGVRMSAAKSRHCLLVVDDEADLVQSVKDLLRFDYRVLGTTRATEGLKIMEQEQVHVVMTDQRMPEMTGVEFLKSLGASYP